MNELGIRKLPRDDDGPDPDKVRPKTKEKNTNIVPPIKQDESVRSELYITFCTKLYC